jgi:hypothetical protein
MGIQIEMADLTDTNKFWAWSGKTYNSIGEFAREYNSQAKKMGEDHLCKAQIALLDLGMQTPTSKWVFRVVI